MTGAQFQVIPSLDLLRGECVRLRQGDFELVTSYGSPRRVLDRLQLAPGSKLHVVDLEASRSGLLSELDLVRAIVDGGFEVQVGGGVRSLQAVEAWIAAGASRIVVGTAAAESPALMRSIVDRFGVDQILPAVDMHHGAVRIEGWERSSSRPPVEIFASLERLGFRDVLVTDVARDGMCGGPSFELYRSLAALTGLQIVASGGVSTVRDVLSLARLQNVRSCVAGRALLDGSLDLSRCRSALLETSGITARVIPCLDVRDGRVVKGVQFQEIREAGDPVECARAYEGEGADELVLLDITATMDGRKTALDTVTRVASSLFIPFTAGGGVRSLEDFRAMLQAGADRVAINTAALTRPGLIAECAAEFGAQAVVVACDAKRSAHGFEAMINGGSRGSGRDAVVWCQEAAQLGAGEILLTSVDRDGTQAGFDLELLRAVTSRLSIGVIASGGAGCTDDFVRAIETGGAQAVLAASLFHDRILTIDAVKRTMAGSGIPVRTNSNMTEASN